MPVTKINGSTFPDNDPRLTSSAPQVGSANYSDAVVEFVRANAPNQFNGRPVGFFDRFINTVDIATAFPGGGGNAALLPLLNLEIWGVVTSAPLADPANGGFIYQRYQRGIMHYRDECQCTERILLAEWFKSVITGDRLPADLAAQMAGTPFIRQYSPGSPGFLARPGELPGTDMTNAFTPDLGGPGPVVGPPPPSGPTSTPAPTVTNDALPTVTIQIDDERIDPNGVVNVTVIGRDDKGVDRIEWREVRADTTNDNDEDRDFDPILRERHPFSCDSRVECANVWSVSPTVSGTHVLEARARDTADQESTPVRVELRIRAGAATATPTLTPGTNPALVAPPTATSTPETTAPNPGLVAPPTATATSPTAPVTP